MINKTKFKILIIFRNASSWRDFCAAVQVDYRPCLSALFCKFEPAMTANLNLFKRSCNNSTELGLAQDKFINCLAEYAESKEGGLCLDKFRGVDILGRDVSSKICGIVDSILNCSAPALYIKCGPEAISHIYSLHQSWLSDFDSSCKIEQTSGLVLANWAKNIISTTTSIIEISVEHIEKPTPAKKNKLNQASQVSDKPTTESEPEPKPSTFSEKKTTTELQETTAASSTTTTKTIVTKTKITTESSESSESINPKLRNRTVKGL